MEARRDVEHGITSRMAFARVRMKTYAHFRWVWQIRRTKNGVRFVGSPFKFVVIIATHVGEDIESALCVLVRVGKQRPHEAPLVLEVEQTRLVPEEAERAEEQIRPIPDEPDRARS